MQRLFLAALAIFVLPVSVSAEDGYVSLFNGKGLTNWKSYGGNGKYTVEDGAIVGTVNDERKNTFLCYDKQYENFILKLEFKYDTPFDSGVQFRSSLKDSTVSGYQCQINPTLFTAAVYDEHGRNRWLNAEIPPGPVDKVQSKVLEEKIDDAYKKNDWNELEIQCVGPSIRTWLNGAPITDLCDTAADTGIIGLQVHAAKTGQIRWKNIRIKELPSTPWIPFFKNKEFVDLEIKPVGTWKFDDDETVVASTPEKEPRDGLVLSKQTYDNFAARVSFQCSTGNSGLYFRAEEVNEPHWLRGFQCEICDHADTAGLWETSGGGQKKRGWVYKPPKENKENLDPKGWNDISIVAVGDRLVTQLNGKQIVDIVDPACMKTGKTALQLHGGGNQGYKFKRYEIKPIPKELVDLIVR